MLCGLFLYWNTAQAIALTAFTDRDNISLNDQLTVTFQLRDAQSSREPDFSPIQEAFDILSNRRSTQTIVNNGSRDQFYEWQLTLSPKRYGKLTIPAISLGSAQSNAIDINVEEAKKIPDSTDNIFMQVTTDKKSVYVQEQVLVTIKLFSKFDWQGKELQAFELNDALFEAVNENEYITQINDTPHVVYEITLVVYPQKSGALVIPSLEFLVQLRSQRRSLLSFNNGPVSRARSAPINIAVKPIPVNNGNDVWLPAKAVQLQQHWSHDIASLIAGEPVTRTITMLADGLSKAQLPPLNLPTHTDINSYTDKEQTDEQRSSKGIISQRIETVAMVPNQAGLITLPEVKVKWWNTTTNTYEIAHIPEQTLKATLPLNTPSVAVARPPELVQQAVSGSTVFTHLTRLLIISQVITGLLLLLFIVLFLRARVARVQDNQSCDKMPDPSDQTIWKMLKRNAADNNSVKFRKNLLLWAEKHWALPMNGLDDIAKHADDAKLQEQLLQLDRSMFTNSNASINLGELLQSIQALRITKRDNNKDNPLKPLYPNG